MSEQIETPILDRIDSPDDLRRLPEDQLEPLAQEMRAVPVALGQQ